MPSTIWKGGPAHRAPYRTTHMRVPEPLKDEIQTLIDAWRRDILAGYPVDLPPAAPPSATETRLKTAIQLLNDSLSLRANAGGAIKQKIREALALLVEG